MSRAPSNDLARLQTAGAAFPTVKLRRGDAIPLEAVPWAWRGFLPLGILTILGGSPGCGKTTIAMSLAAILTRGDVWPDGRACEEPGDVLVWSGEDGSSVLAARLHASGADMARVHFIEGIASGDDGEPTAFDPGTHMALLIEQAEQLQAPRLLILDPIVSAVAGDSHKSAEVRRSLAPVVTLAQRLGCAVLGITHFSKGTAGRDPVERITGSLAFGALARMVWIATTVKPPPGETEAAVQRVMMRAKSNIGPDTGGFDYSLALVEVAPGVEGQRVQWGAMRKGSARDILAAAEAEPTADDASAGDVADVLKQLLANGPQPAKEVQAEVEAAGFSWSQAQRTAGRMGILRKKTGMKGGWVWALPGAEGGTPAPEDDEGGNLEELQSSQSSVSSSG